MDKVNEFLDKYHELENYAKARFNCEDGPTAITRLLQHKSLKAEKAKLMTCKDVRRLLSHNPKINNSYPVTPSDELINLLTKIVEKINKPPKCCDFAIPFKDVYFRKIDDHVLETMKTMKEKVYTHVPIMENGKVTGIFSDNTLFAYILEEKIIEINKDMTFKDIERFLPVNVHLTETFRFVPYNMDIYALEEEFHKALHKEERIGMLFLTQNGKENEKLLGIITPWDLIGGGYFLQELTF